MGEEGEDGWEGVVVVGVGGEEEWEMGRWGDGEIGRGEDEGSPDLNNTVAT